jgi:hypothetical protein
VTPGSASPVAASVIVPFKVACCAVSKKGEKQTKQKMILNGRVNLVIIVWYVVNSIFGKNGVNVASF